MNIDNGATRPDFVVSNQDGKTSSAGFVEVVAGCLRGLGYNVSVNWPYKGAELIGAYSDPARGRHSLQIEVNRALYLDEARFVRNAGFAALRDHLDQLLEAVAAYVRSEVPAIR